MIQISKDEYLFICKHIPEPYVTICSKRKHGSKGSKASGKTYYCAEGNKYISLLKQYHDNMILSNIL